jgi:hypothetical protein
MKCSHCDITWRYWKSRCTRASRLSGLTFLVTFMTRIGSLARAARGSRPCLLEATVMVRDAERLNRDLLWLITLPRHALSTVAIQVQVSHERIHLKCEFT